MDKTKDKPNIIASAPKPKEKRRSNEKRKEKSRDAARCRRSRETEIFTELGQVLPLQREEVEQLDKASIMRLSIAYLKIRDMLNLFPNVNIHDQTLLPSEDDRNEEFERKPFDLLNGPESYKYLASALDGFLLILSGEGDVTYVSESISDYLGISQIDLLGQQIWEYTHQCDHDELKEALNIRRSNLGDEKPKEGASNGNAGINGAIENNNTLTTAHRDIFLRLKCTLTSRGRSVNIKSASYKVIHVTGHMVMNTSGDRTLIGIGRPLPHPSNIEIPLGSATFLTKHSLDMKFTYVDDKMLSLLGYQPEDLLGKSLYDCHHGADSESLMTTFKSVLSKGQGETCRYRFLGKCGGYCWVVTQATIVYDKQKPQSVVCVNYAISELENNNEIYSCAQLEAHHQNKEISTKDEQDNIQQQQRHHESSPSKYYSPEKLQNAVNIRSGPCALEARLNPRKTLLKSQQPLINSTGENQPVATKRCEATIQPDIRNNNNTTNIRKRLDDISLSPIRRNFTNCSISPGGKTSPTPSPTPDKRPKSVTASVFTQVPINNNTEPITIQNQQPSQQLSVSSSVGINLPIALNVGNQQQSQLNNHQQPAAPTKSVTASVLTPISSLTTPINRAFLPNNFCKNQSRNTTNSVNNNNSNSNNTTEDMNSRYLMFSEESPELTMLKEEPDDLTHLAPSLDDSTQLFGEMLDSLILPDAYGTLLSDDINSLDSQQSNCNNSKNNNNHHIDPFINYRDESSDTSSSPHLLSPGSVSKSPEMSSIPSLCSPNSLSQDDEFAFMTMNVEDDIDLTMRAPYIPMNEQEDLPLLTDLMWSAFSEELSLHKEALQMEALKNSQNSALSNNSSNNTSSSNSLTTTASTTTVNTSSSNTSNHNSSSNKNSIITAQDTNSLNDNESSLAALLCGSGGVSSLQQHQHHQQSDVGENDSTSSGSATGNDCKRRKILLERNDDATTDLMDSIDDFSPVFNKNSSNVGCWTMNDLLQMNGSAPSSPTTSLHHQQPEDHSEKQNIIINTAIPATAIHVPLITIQNKNSNSKMNCSSILTNSTATTTNTTVNNTSNNNSTSNNSVTMRRLSATLVKGININLTQSNNPNNNSNLTSGKSVAANLNIGAIINTQSANSSSKRPSNIILTSSDTKRLKNSPMVETPASPHLLQQLMAPSPQRAGSKSSYEKIHGRWNGDNDGTNSTGVNSSGRGSVGHQSSTSTASQSQPSNSVLKNLLVSGCDDAFHQFSDAIIEEDRFSRSLQNSPQPNFYAGRPLMCKVSTEQVLRRCGANPLIGGVGILPSPPIPIDTDVDEGGRDSITPHHGSMDPLVAGTFSPGGSDSGGSDSGVECGQTPSRGPSLFYSLFRNMNREKETTNDGMIFNGTSKMDTSPPPSNQPALKMSSTGRGAGGSAGLGERGSHKMSFSFLDEDNPLCSPFLMDLCNDDYSMDEPLGGDFLQENEITKVLNGWPPANAAA